MPSNARWEKLTVEGVDMDLFVDEPSTPGPHPAIVVAHHRAGNDAATTKFVQDLAGNGYVAASPHLHHRRPDGEDTRESLANLDDNQIVADLKATVDLLAALESVNADRMGIAGHCMGGRVSFLGAASIEAFKCNVAYYSGNIFKTMGTGDAPRGDYLVENFVDGQVASQPHPARGAEGAGGTGAAGMRCLGAALGCFGVIRKDVLDVLGFVGFPIAL